MTVANVKSPMSLQLTTSEMASHGQTRGGQQELLVKIIIIIIIILSYKGLARSIQDLQPGQVPPVVHSRKA